MQGKVEICGVNTAKLPVLKNEETIALMKKARAGDQRARDELISGNLRLVLSVIQRFQGRGESADDLFQVGCIGLIKAVDNFDYVNHDVMFSTYGVPMITGEIRRFLRDNSAVRVSRSIRDVAYKVLVTKERLQAETQREPKPEEIAEALGISRAEVVTAMDAVAEPVSLYEPVYADSGDAVLGIDQIGDENASSDVWLRQIAFEEAMAGLSDREKRILALRFFDGKTQMEVAKEIGISQAQVSRLEKSAVDRIKSSL